MSSIAAVTRLGTVGSTNDVVRERLAAGAPAIDVVVADHQSAGRGRDGRAWIAPPGAALLASIGFRPVGLAPADAWRLAAVVSLAMADAAEEVAGLPDGAVRLKWPNDLVVEVRAAEPELIDLLPLERSAVAAGGRPGASRQAAAEPVVRKLGGVLGETAGLGTADPTVIVGIGVNADWAARDFPVELAGSMISLREASGGRPIERERLLDAFLARVEPRVAALEDGRFDAAAWSGRQLTNGRLVRLDLPDGTSEVVRAAGVDVRTGALLVVDSDAAGDAAGGIAGASARASVERPVLVGEITHLHLAAGV